jgi:hypothetical protein
MKKRNFIIVMIILLALSFVLIGCNSTRQIDRYYERLKKADSATIIIDMQVPIFGKMSMTMKMDDNKQYFSAIFDDVEKYTEVVGDKTYIYTRNPLGNWIKTESQTEEDEVSIEEEFEELFNSKNYEYSKDLEKFVLKDDVNPEFWDEMQANSLTLEIDGDNCIISGEVNSKGMVMEISITIKDLNKTEITLPTVT